MIWQAPEATASGALTLFKTGNSAVQLNMYTLYFAWGVTEVLRYGFFAVKVVITLDPFTRCHRSIANS